jgi:hypothetical protein
MEEYRDGKPPASEQPGPWRPLPSDTAMTRTREAETELGLSADEQWALRNVNAPAAALPSASNELGHEPRHAKTPTRSLPASPLRGYVHLDYAQPQLEVGRPDAQSTPPSQDPQTSAAAEADGSSRDWFAPKVRPPAQT